jgi:hypothetical protein
VLFGSYSHRIPGSTQKRAAPASGVTGEQQMDTQGPHANITLSYKIGGGLFNQHIDHENAMMLAVTLRVQHVRWVPAQDRESCDVKWNRQKWKWMNYRDIYDMQKIRAYFQSVLPAVHCPLVVQARHCRKCCVCGSPIFRTA